MASEKGFFLIGALKGVYRHGIQHREGCESRGLKSCILGISEIRGVIDVIFR